MSAAARRRRREGDEPLDADLLDLPPAARWREWMLRVEAAIFASAKPVPREALVRLVGEDCRFDDLIADLIHELRGRPYDLTLVAGGYALRTKTRFAPAIRAAHPGLAGDDVARAHQDGDLCADGDCLFAAGDAGGDFQAGGTGDQPRRHRRPQAPWADRRRHPRPSARRPVRLCDDEKIPGGVRLRLPTRPARPRAAQRPNARRRAAEGGAELDGALGLFDEEDTRCKVRAELDPAGRREPLTGGGGLGQGIRRVESRQSASGWEVVWSGSML